MPGVESRPHGGFAGTAEILESSLARVVYEEASNVRVNMRETQKAAAGSGDSGSGL